MNVTDYIMDSYAEELADFKDWLVDSLNDDADIVLDRHTACLILPLIRAYLDYKNREKKVMP